MPEFKDTSKKTYKHILYAYTRFCETTHRPPMLDTSALSFLKFHEKKSKSYKRLITHVLEKYLNISLKVQAKQYIDANEKKISKGEEITIPKITEYLACMLNDPTCHECILLVKLLFHTNSKPSSALKFTPRKGKILIETLLDCPYKSYIASELLPFAQNMEDTEPIFKKSYRLYLGRFQKYSGIYFKKCGFMFFVQRLHQLNMTL